MSSACLDLGAVRLRSREIPWFPFFIGRAKELNELRTTVVRKSIFDRVVVLQGPPGIGKSSLAVKYADEFHDDYSGIFWLDASSPLHLAASFSRVRALIDKNPSEVPMERIDNGLLSLKQDLKRYSKGHRSTKLWGACAASEDVQAVQHWLGKANNDPWLLIFDNYRPLPESSDAKGVLVIENFFPETRQGHVVITTQSPVAGRHMIRLGKMDANEAVQILSLASQRRDIPTGSVILSVFPSISANT